MSCVNIASNRSVSSLFRVIRHSYLTSALSSQKVSVYLAHSAASCTTLHPKHVSKRLKKKVNKDHLSCLLICPAHLSSSFCFSIWEVPLVCFIYHLPSSISLSKRTKTSDRSLAVRAPFCDPPEELKPVSLPLSDPHGAALLCTSQ